jgi:DcuC family C4-dicarboxylate transporter
MDARAWLALGVVIATVAAVRRGLDVRLTLLLAALPLSLATGETLGILGIMARELTNPATVIPIGASMGFAFVIRETGCDRDLIQLLLKPLRASRAMLIPGGILAGYIINTTIVSQAGTAAVLGPILLPLLRAGGISPVLGGAALLMGASMGGELFNPGAVEIRTLANLTGRSSIEVIHGIAPRNLTACLVSLGVFWFLARRRPRPREDESDIEAGAGQGAGAGAGADSCSGAGSPTGNLGAETRINLLRAFVPLLPLVLLFLEPSLARSWGLTRLVTLPDSFDARLQEPATILVAMLVGVMVAGLVAPRSHGRLTHAFFEGAGYAYTHVISLIVVAMMFASALESSGLVLSLARQTRWIPWILEPATWLLACFFAWVCGSGIAPAVAIMKIVVPEAESLGFSPIEVGGMAAIGAHFGRTMSPAAAVVAMSARLAQERPDEVRGPVIVPLLAGGAVMIVLSAAGL